MNKNYAVSVKNATVKIKGKTVLDDISWHVGYGDKYFILGANGAGKTTLVKMLLGYIWGVHGSEVEVLGKRFGHCDLNELRKSIAWVSPFIQKYLEGQSTGVDTVLSGSTGALGYFRQASSEELERVENLLNSLNAIHLANKSILEMSSGEQMKILIARALFSNPKIMILDEPSVYLDISEREFFLNKINELIKSHPDLTVIFISQRIEDILPVFNQGLILKNGKIAYMGEREEVLREENLKITFGLDIKLIKTESGRLWSIVK